MSNIGRSAPPKKELVTQREIRKYSISTGQRQEKYLNGDEAPPLFHVALFWHVVEMDKLKPDGIPNDPMMPELPLKRAMAGGIKIQYHRKIVPGDVLVAKRTLTDIYEKQGRQGPLIFCEMTMEVETEAGEPVITEKTTRILR